MQQVQFVYLTQSDYNNLSTKQASRLYFTSDTKRIYRGDTLFADGNALTQEEIDSISCESVNASSISVDGKSVSLEGHTHYLSEINDFYSGAIANGNGGYVTGNAVWTSVSTKAQIGTNISDSDKGVKVIYSLYSNKSPTIDVAVTTGQIVSGNTSLVTGGQVYTSISSLATSISSIQTRISGETSSTIAKSDATFSNLTVNSQFTLNGTMSVDDMECQTLNASSITVDGSSVSLEGHTHLLSQITDFYSGTVTNGNTGYVQGWEVWGAISSKASIGTSNSTSTGVKVTCSLYSAAKPSITVAVTPGQIVSGNTSVVTGGTVYTSINALKSSISTITSSISGITSNSISKSNATFSNLTVNTQLTLNGNMSVDSMECQALNASAITVDGSSVSLVGHTHSLADITDYSSGMGGGTTITQGTMGSISSLSVNVVSLSEYMTMCSISSYLILSTVGQMYFPYFNQLDANNTTIVNVATPSNDTDAANKAYVDAHAGSGGGGASIGTSTDTSYGVKVTYSLYSNSKPTIDVSVTPGEIVSGNTSVVTGGIVYDSLKSEVDTDFLNAKVMYVGNATYTSTSNNGEEAIFDCPVEFGKQQVMVNDGVKLVFGDADDSDAHVEMSRNSTTNKVELDGSPILTENEAFGNIYQKTSTVSSTTITLDEYTTFYKKTISTGMTLSIADPASTWQSYVVTFEVELNITASGLSVNVPWTWIDELLAPDLTQAGCYTIAVRGKYRNGAWVWRANIQDTESAY